MIIKNIQPVDKHELLHGEYVVILKATRIPPHIGILINGVFYDFSVRGIDVEPDLDKLLSMIGRKKLPTLFVQVGGNCDQNRMLEILKKYELVNDNHTCLAPLKEYYHLPDVGFVFELLANLEIKGAQQLNLTDAMENGTFVLRTYTTEDIMNRIAESKQQQANA